MTTYVSIPNGDIDQDSPITQPLMTALRDNPIAIAEADSTVPAGLLPTVHLGTFTTTTGTTVTLSSLVLTPYKFIMASFDGVTIAAVGSNVAVTCTIAGPSVYSETVTGNPVLRGIMKIDLTNGAGFASIGSLSGAAPSSAVVSARSLRSAITTATTSISVTCTTNGSGFTAGAVRLYGVK
jgi:hypothetical protein